MSRPQDTLKRKRPGSGGPLNQSLVDSEKTVLDVIKSKEDMGIWTRDIKREAKLPDNVVDKSIKSLQQKNLIKEVVNIQNKGRKHFMAVEFEPSKQVTGGAWYVEGNLDKAFISTLKDICLKIVRSLKVTTVEGVCEFVKKNKLMMVECTSQQISEILNSMVLDNEIIEVKSTGLGEYHNIRIGTLCYRVAGGDGGGVGQRIGAMASIPCGACPRINQCTPDGVISPSTCVYFTKWLDLDF